jgi:murein DD-endopeptidase MepM/ murein hydrolase activator NlpD
MSQYFEFMYIRNGNGGVRTLRIRKTIAIVVLAVVVGLIASSISILASHAGDIARAIELKKLDSQNGALRAEIGRFGAQIAELRKAMDASFNLQNRARMLASLDPISNDVWHVGVGGPEPLPLQMETAYPDSIFLGLNENLGTMLRQSKLQLDSYREVISVLDKEQEVRESTPAIRPVKGGFLSSRFGRRMDPFLGEITLHTGVDYRARTGSPVVATADGVVSFAGRDGGFGYMIEIDHGNGFRTRYAHLSKILVARGQRVKRSEMIGLVGNTGHSTGSHLHYEVLFRKAHRDPLQYVLPEGVSFD